MFLLFLQKVKGALAYWSSLDFFAFALHLNSTWEEIDVMIPVLACLQKYYQIFSLYIVFFSFLPSWTQQGARMSTDS